jgi:membrane protein implicated in regulation of membrane protease activity
MLRVVTAASRRALAVMVLASAGVFAFWTARFRFPPAREHPTVGGLRTAGPVWPRPEWAVPAAIVIVLIGTIVAALLYSPRRGRADRRALQADRPDPGLSR